MKVLVLNGPNLGRLGIREPDVYGARTHDDLVVLCQRVGVELGLEVDVRQTDYEGVMMSWLHEAADTAIQLNGARGYSKDTVLEWIYRYARQARLVDGADEVHKMVLNRNLEVEGDTFWSWPVGA